MIKVNIQINSKSWKTKIKNPKTYLSSKLKKIPKFIRFFKNKNVTFTILLTNSFNMKKLNKKFRKRNKSADVLSFPSFTPKDLKKIKVNKIYIGDIAVSYEIINKRSKNIFFNLEFDKVWIHGLLHLIGYNHIKNKDYYKMNKIEKRILNSI
jgi:probable rRNA maturation factor